MMQGFTVCGSLKAGRHKKEETDLITDMQGKEQH